MPWPLPSAKNYGHDATMRGFRTELHASASLPRRRIYGASIARAGERRFLKCRAAPRRARWLGRSEARTGPTRTHRPPRRSADDRRGFTWKPVRIQVHFRQTLPVDDNP